MNKDFIELTKENLPSGKMTTGKIIKSNRVKIKEESRIISNEEYTQPNLNETDNTSQSTNEKENNKLFTFKPEYNENDLVELSVNCSCGNHTKIIFKKEDPELISEEPQILQSESDESTEELKQSEN